MGRHPPQSGLENVKRWECWITGALLAVAVASPGLASSADDQMRVAAWFEQRSLQIPTWSSIVVCHGYGCTFRTPIALRAQDRVTFAKMMQAKTPAAERQGIAKVVQWFDK